RVLFRSARMLTPAREQLRVDLLVLELSHLAPADPRRFRGVQHRSDALTRHALRGRDRPARQALCAQLQNQLRSDLPYHSRLVLPPRALYTRRRERKQADPQTRYRRTPATRIFTCGWGLSTSLFPCGSSAHSRWADFSTFIS